MSNQVDADDILVEVRSISWPCGCLWSGDDGWLYCERHAPKVESEAVETETTVDDDAH